MINVGKCPKCSKNIHAVNIEHVDVNQSFQTKWHGVSLVCPHCDTVLGAAIDPIALKNDIIQEIGYLLGKG
jgi:hypothetical protein